ncbi:MAG TPA: ABC transporter ATP-binding protein/permease [Firmicutes bacterium]|nr:ABC transporter ATP-binding protein/permease [Bacillota bacterium]
MAGEVIFDLFQPKLMSGIVDEGVLNGNMQVILSTGLLMLLFTFLGGLCGVGGAAFGTAAAQNFGNDLRKDVFSRVMHLSLSQTDDFTTGSLVTRLTNDITAVQELVSMALRMFVRAPMSFIGGIVMALSLNVNFGLVLVIALPIQLLVIWLLLSKASPLFGLVQKKLDKVNAVVQENVTGARMVKAYVREDYEENRFRTANNDLMQTSLRVQKLMAILNPLLMIVMNFSVVAIILIGGFQVEARAMQVGQVMAAVTYVTQILMSIMMVSMMFQSISRARASAARIREVLDTLPAIADGEQKGTGSGQGGSISFKNVGFRYSASERPVLEDINLDIHPGETIAILGATGAGKTTLCNLIPRFYDPTKGEIFVDGRPVTDYTLEELRKKIAFVLQKSELFSGTIADNIRWGRPDATDDEVIAAAKVAQADEFITGFQDGYQTIIGEKGASLSGGQKQRLSITRAVLRQPEILLFDDSTSALDLGTEARLRDALRESMQHTTVIMVAQRVASVMHADRILVLDGGRIAACGRHEELLQTSAIYQDIYSSQVGKGGSAHA